MAEEALVRELCSALSQIRFHSECPNGAIHGISSPGDYHPGKSSNSIRMRQSRWSLPVSSPNALCICACGASTGTRLASAAHLDTASAPSPPVSVSPSLRRRPGEDAVEAGAVSLPVGMALLAVCSAASHYASTLGVTGSATRHWHCFCRLLSLPLLLLPLLMSYVECFPVFRVN